MRSLPSVTKSSGFSLAIDSFLLFSVSILPTVFYARKVIANRTLICVCTESAEVGVDNVYAVYQQQTTTPLIINTAAI